MLRIDMRNITWTCHICGEERPDNMIAVHKTDLSSEHGLPPETMQQNVRYCKDKPDCFTEALNFRFNKKGK